MNNEKSIGKKFFVFGLSKNSILSAMRNASVKMRILIDFSQLINTKRYEKGTKTTTTKNEQSLRNHIVATSCMLCMCVHDI